ncbi:MAG: HAD-IA family hydrolase [Eubacteriales bacterium]|nr:HAD-IA family hydrolase [Eubacteriales bacterium]
MDREYFGVVFDMDAVIVNSYPVILTAAIKVLSEYGIDAQPEDFAPYIGAGEDVLIGAVVRKYGLPYSVHIKERVYEVYAELVPEMLQVYDGVHELMLKLKKDGWFLGLVSSGDFPKLEANLEMTKIPRDIFSSILSGEKIERQKPYPEIYLKTADQLQILPYSCISIENSPNGINAAKRAGMQCIAVANTFSEEELEREIPDHVCKELKDVYDIISSYL